MIISYNSFWGYFGGTKSCHGNWRVTENILFQVVFYEKV